MPKPMSKLDIMNTMGDAADKKAKMASSPKDDDDDSSYSPKAQKTIGNKMSAMKGEDRPQKQKVAIALNEARSKGLKVPKSS